MSKELVVSYEEGKVKIVILEGGRIQELHEDEVGSNFTVGDIILGKVKKLAPSLNACFVNIGYPKDAFLHYHDLGPQVKSSLKYIKGVSAGKINTPKLTSFSFEEDINKDGLIQNVLAPNQEILVQITKEPISTKGPRISSEISLAGRYLVLIPFASKTSISRNISTSEEKDRLRKVGDQIRPSGFGLIIRTVAEGKTAEELQSDLRYLLNKWNSVCYRNIKKGKPPVKILGELDKASSILRDNFNEDFISITCDDENLAQEMQDYLSVIAPEKSKLVKYYDSHIPIFEYYNIDKQIKQLFGKHVNIHQSKGAYLIIEHTEAMHVIDVNSGNVTANQKTQEDAALHVNKLAAAEIARQLRLRDIGGIIVIDFIDLISSQHKKELYEYLKEVMKDDKAKHKILPPSKFGLIQVTRQRVRPQKQLNTTEDNPNPNGKIESPIVLIDRIQENISNIITSQKGRIYLHVHPFVAAYLTKGLKSIRNEWFFKYKRWIKIIPRDSFKYLEFQILNDKKEVLHKYSN
ncbi:Rne/Rng family ribonuclease [Apibacter raozihei]|uniref:Rne/Rng family ribonuclease n=1 Tax=Apibacter TaxID=1778601 RepID=UPI000FE36984|nr:MULTISPECIES: Rne/Rng family ribonuclease [Apibacter]